MLARSLEGYRRYFERNAVTWERQAMSRARFVAGDSDIGRRFMALLDDFVWEPGLSEDDLREIRRIKARIEKERIPSSENPEFHLKLGRGSLSDVEFTAQMLQLRHGVREPSTMGALDALLAADVLSRDDHAVLAEAYRFCEQTRNRWYLVKSAPSNSLPQQPEQLRWLARAMETTPKELREHYRRVTRRSRAVVERLLFGRT
jgi:glutamate-ammonia-ligase adenylyltransferase